MTKRSYHDFINTMNAFVRAKNRSMIVWEGFDPAPGETAATIDTNVVVCAVTACCNCVLWLRAVAACCGCVLWLRAVTACCGCVL